MFNKRPNKILLFLILFFLALCLQSRTASATNKILMITDAKCPICVIWEKEIGRIYPKTDAAKRYPLYRIEIHNYNQRKNSNSIKQNVTPTFIIIENGNEKGRIIGYSNAELFWWELDSIIE
ncbi:MAG: hypothetical protein ACJZ9G_12005 [Rhodospirillales bacterium]